MGCVFDRNLKTLASITCFFVLVESFGSLEVNVCMARARPAHWRTKQARAHAKNKKVSAALRKSILPYHSLPLVSLYLFSFTARIDIRNCLCLVPVHQERVIFMNRHNKGLHSLGLAPNCAIQICFHFQFVIAAANFYFAYFGLLATWSWLRQQVIHDSFSIVVAFVDYVVVPLILFRPINNSNSVIMFTVVLTWVEFKLIFNVYIIIFFSDYSMIGR